MATIETIRKKAKDQALALGHSMGRFTSLGDCRCLDCDLTMEVEGNIIRGRAVVEQCPLSKLLDEAAKDTSPKVNLSAPGAMEELRERLCSDDKEPQAVSAKSLLLPKGLGAKISSAMASLAVSPVVSGTLQAGQRREGAELDRRVHVIVTTAPVVGNRHQRRRAAKIQRLKASDPTRKVFR